MIDALRSYVQLATGLLEAAADRTKETATSVVSQGLDVGGKGPETVSNQVQGIAEDLIEQGRTNREMLIGLVRTEVERTVGRMGFVREEELAAVRRHVERLERELNTRGDQASAAASAAVVTATTAVPAATKVATKAAGTAAGAATRAAAEAARLATETAGGAARRAPSAGAAPAAEKAATPKKVTTAKKTTAKKTAAKKTTAKKTTAKKTTS